MDLLLVRHARAFDRDSAAWPDDARRPLTAEGREAFIVLARKLGRLDLDVELVESSNFVRAWQTAMILCEETRWPKPLRHERLEGASGEESIESLVSALQGMLALNTVVWVGHEPMLSRLAARLLTGRTDGAAIEFKKGAVVALRLHESGKTLKADLLWMLTPRLVARLQKSKAAKRQSKAAKRPGKID